MFRPVHLALLFAVVALTAACKPSEPSSTQPEAVPAQVEVAPVEAAPVEAATAAVMLPAALQAGAGTAAVGAALAADGWLPLHDRAGCMARLGNRASLCHGAPELVSCDGMDCTLEFANAKAMQRLSLVVNAPAASDAQETPAFGAVKSWMLAAMPASAPAQTCPATDFEGFLKAFAADPQLRARHTAPLVRVALMIDRGDAGDRRQDVFVLASNYTTFALSYHDAAWYPSVDADAPRPAPIDVRITADADGAHDVNIPGNVEGISYRFERDGACWRLVGDPVAAI